MSNYTVEIRRHGQLAGLTLWALPVDVLIILLACWVMGGCGSRVTTADPASEVPHDAYLIDGYFNVADFRLRDGTRCVAVGGNTGRGITCDWSRHD